MVTRFACTSALAPILVAGLLFALNSSASSQDSKSSIYLANTNRDCISRYKSIQFVFGRTSFVVDASLVDRITIKEVRDRNPKYTCDPKVENLAAYFSRAVLVGAEIERLHHTKYFFLSIKRSTAKETNENENENKNAGISNPIISNITYKRTSRVANNQRVYRLRYSGEMISEVIVSCGGEANEPGGRQCFTVWPGIRIGDAAIHYKYRQDEVPYGGSKGDDEFQISPEAATVAEFDYKIRSWLLKVQKRKE